LETTLETPLTCLKTASTPQKHPPAKTAVAALVLSLRAREPLAAALHKTTRASKSVNDRFVRKSIEVLPKCSTLRPSRKQIGSLILAQRFARPYPHFAIDSQNFTRD
jgi:hypothetical protein